MTDKHAVRVTQEPGVVREVSDAELLDLARQGLIHSYERTDEAKATLADVKLGKLASWKDADKKSDTVTAPDPIGATVPVTDTKGE